MKDIKSTVAKNILFYRKQKKMSQKELADKIGVKHNTISSWENCTNTIDIDSLYNIGEILNVPINTLFGKEETDMAHTPEIISYYNSLNEIGKQKATEYILDLSEQPKYTKPQEAELNNFPEFQIAAYDGDGVEIGKANATYEELKKLFDDM